MPLHEIWPANCYCGPAALAALTGCDAIKDVRGWINAVRKRAHNCGVRGMRLVEMSAVLASRGYAAEQFNASGTLAEFVAAHPAGFYIVNVTRHFVALCDSRIADNHVRFGCAIEEHPSRRCHVKKAWHILNA